MDHLSAIESFLSFVGNNEKRFSYKPFVTKMHSDSLEFGLSGITPEIQCSVSVNEIEVHALRRDTHWDILRFFDMPKIKVGARKYSCELCDQAKVRFYSSSYELFADHCFEPFLRWVNETFHERSILCFFGTIGATWAKVSDSDLLNGDGGSKCLLQSVPAVITRHRR